MDSSNGGLVGALFGALVAIAFAILMIAAMWKVFVKAGQPGWASIVPIYNIICLLNITGKPTWWIVLFLLPVANIIAAILVVVALAKSFGKSTGFAMGLLFLGFIFFPILGFGDARYIGPVGDAGAVPSIA
jgi:uncharacterized protein DUF5684